MEALNVNLWFGQCTFFTSLAFIKFGFVGKLKTFIVVFIYNRNLHWYFINLMPSKMVFWLKTSQIKLNYLCLSKMSFINIFLFESKFCIKQNNCFLLSDPSDHSSGNHSSGNHSSGNHSSGNHFHPFHNLYGSTLHLFSSLCTCPFSPPRQSQTVSGHFSFLQQHQEPPVFRNSQIMKIVIFIWRPCGFQISWFSNGHKILSFKELFIV